MTYHLIGLAGEAQHGKDTAAIPFLKAGFKPFAFADAMKKGLLAVDPWVPVSLGQIVRLSQLISEVGWDEAKKNPEVRRLMQRYGTEGGRDIHGYDCWVKIFERLVDSEPDDYVIKDVRFVEEAEAIHRRGGRIYKIVRPGFDNGLPAHSSEQIPDECVDVVIYNTSTIEALHYCVAGQFYDDTCGFSLVSHAMSIK
jgi:hypothetical protein